MDNHTCTVWDRSCDFCWDDSGWDTVTETRSLGQLLYEAQASPAVMAQIEAAEAAAFAKRMEPYRIPDDPPTTEGMPERQWWTPFDDFEQPLEPPTPFFARDDGRLLLYRRSLSWLYGPSGFGKSWVALMAVKQALDNDYNVAYLDYEMGIPTFKERALMLGLWQHLKDGNLRHVEGHNLELGDRAEIAEWSAADDGEGLVIIDSAGSAGCPDDSPKGVPEWLTEHLRPFQLLPDHKRPAIIVVDHVSKNPQGRAPGPIGAQAKMREITGVAVKVVGDPWTRTEGGTITLICEKDRRGYWKKNAPMATVVGTWTDGAFGYRIEEPQETNGNGNGKPIHANWLALKDHLFELILTSGDDGISYNPLCEKVNETHHMTRKRFGKAIKDLLDDELVTKERRGKYVRYVIPH